VPAQTGLCVILPARVDDLARSQIEGTQAGGCLRWTGAHLATGHHSQLLSPLTRLILGRKPRNGPALAQATEERGLGGPARANATPRRCLLASGMGAVRCAYHGADSIGDFLWPKRLVCVVSWRQMRSCPPMCFVTRAYWVTAGFPASTWAASPQLSCGQDGNISSNPRLHVSDTARQNYSKGLAAHGITIIPIPHCPQQQQQYYHQVTSRDPRGRGMKEIMSA
jgi:hypothetical protein